MVSAVHDDDTDYSDLDEEAPLAAPALRHHSGPKTRKRVSENTPLLSTSPPPPAYADVTRLYGTPPYVARNDSNLVRPNEFHHQDATTSTYTRTEEPESMGDPERNAQDGRKVTKKRNILTNRKALACLVFILTCSLIGLLTVTTVKHDKSQDSNSGNGSPSPVDGFPHYMRCNIGSIGDPQTFTFHAPRSFSFVEITEGAHNPSSDINGQVRVMLGEEDQEHPLYIELRIAKSTAAQHSQFKIEYTGESLRVNAPAYSPSSYRACMEIDLRIWIKPGAQLEHLEIATEHLDIRVEPGLFPPSLETTRSGQSDAYYISNNTDFITVIGSLYAAYWESGRETRIDTVSGSISGRFSLKDVLSVKTVSGNININVEPKAESPTDPRPASFEAITVSGGIKAIFPMSSTIAEIPPRFYHTKVESRSGSVHGNYIHGINTDITTSSGSIDVNVLPYTADSTGSWLRTESAVGGIHVNVLPSYEDPEDVMGHLRSVHKTKSGSLHIKYPQQWEGKIEAVTMSGSVKLRGKDVEVLKRWSGAVGAHVVAQKGEASSAMDLSTSSGSVDATIGEL
ncbi:hypothetical protein KCU81_g4678, partial [Aureobasidium melanogenum]|uniref:Adhesin domain-containing protein n=1 Tax=Aureobasidium melanogenum (strain CBS 110374) TaxID=1043003 RepID=A0A074VT36_AURM1